MPYFTSSGISEKLLLWVLMAEPSASGYLALSLDSYQNLNTLSQIQ